jgi:NAD+ kinase
MCCAHQLKDSQFCHVKVIAAPLQWLMCVARSCVIVRGRTGGNTMADNSMKLCILNSGSERAQAAQAEISARYTSVSPEEADVIVALGGDGFLLHAIHDHRRLGKPIFGMNRGTVGFLLNAYDVDDLKQRITAARRIQLAPIRIEATDSAGKTHELLAYNEMSIVRYSNQSVNLRLFIDGRRQVDKYVGDGLIYATPAGSTAYNLAVRGPILPLVSNVLALTPVSPFRPRRWFGAVVPNTTKLEVEVLDHTKRPVGASGDFNEVRDVVHVRAALAPDEAVTVLFDPQHSLEDRIVSEQFFGA